MKTKSRTHYSRAAVVASVLGISMLGNLRSQASEAPSPAVQRLQAASSQRNQDAAGAVEAGSVSTFGADVDDGGAGGAIADGDDGHLVPAIYAWDPDVRFVYYRHVSKWM